MLIEHLGGDFWNPIADQVLISKPCRYVVPSASFGVADPQDCLFTFYQTLLLLLYVLFAIQAWNCDIYVYVLCTLLIVY